MRLTADQPSVPSTAQPATVEAAHLEPGLFAPGDSKAWSSQNRTILAVPHPVLAKLALAVQGKLPREQLNSPSPPVSDEKCVQVWGQPSTLSNRQTFISETHASFTALQLAMKANKMDTDGVLRISGQYRAALLKQVEKEKDNGQYEVFGQMHAVWHLLEILYLTTVKDGLNSCVVAHMLEWLNTNFSPSSLEDSVVVAGRQAKEIAVDKSLWPLIARLAVRGHLTVLANILQGVAKELGEDVSRLARSVAKVARSMPVLSNGEEKGGFLGRWRKWTMSVKDVGKEIAQALVDQPGNAALEGLQVAISIIAGKDEAIAGASQSWQDALGAMLLYQEPTAQADRLPELTDAAAEQFEISDFRPLDNALLVLLKQDLPTFLPLCDQIDSWLSAHAADLLTHLGIIDTFRHMLVVDPRPHYLVALAEQYMENEGMWQVVLDYLGAAGEHEVMQEVIMRVPLSSDRVAQKVLEICEKHRLETALNRILRQLGRQRWRRGRRGAAIADFARAGDNLSITAICEELWSEYMASGVLSYGSTIDGVAGLAHPRVQFLARYRDFHAMYAKGEMKQAGVVLLDILVGELAPKSVVADLLVDAIPLLEGDVLVFGQDATLELMR
ncbi:hypothetical protein FBU59_002964, partial [Linderina macrospora]